MTPGKLSEKVIVDRSDWVREMVLRIRALPLGSPEEFTSEPVTVDAAESRLRRALEALRRGGGGQHRLADVEAVLGALHRWVRAHPERIDREL